MRQTTRWIGSTNKSNVKLSKLDRLECEDLKQRWTADDLKSLTVPGQSKSIKEMMDRYEKGRPNPVD